ncbi:hypothetical protein GYMLUDRAFT_50298 [Collybiopsis luxurians FD-317 M1]|uniref:Uncharacterized protein n=1 Tax=Collybiopsis luxurians FD-317 M1 TaxID=944289 RepID=A0A0D0BQF2_9AGAR|nr:hypothetical protein GYMLUDRAFT_50298 [Collybiopsis luxurians FD-317 M1]
MRWCNGDGIHRKPDSWSGILVSTIREFDIPISKSALSTLSPIFSYPVWLDPHRHPRLFSSYPNTQVSLISQTESFYVFLIPSILRAIALNLVADSLRSVLFTNQSVLSMTPTLSLSPPFPLQPAQLLGVSVWPEGCLTKRKDYTRLAKERVTSRLYTWLFEFSRWPNKWEPLYIAMIPSVPTEELSKLSCNAGESGYYAKSARG